MTTPDTPLESWRQVFRSGIAPSLSTAALEALRDACYSDDPRLTQGSTTTPPPLMCVQDWPCEAACPIGYAGWASEGLTTVEQAHEFFCRICSEADQRLGEPAAVRWFLNAWDDTPRNEIIRELGAECDRALAERKPNEAA